jgi:hypothetical protein
MTKMDPVPAAKRTGSFPVEIIVPIGFAVAGLLGGWLDGRWTGLFWVAAGYLGVCMVTVELLGRALNAKLVTTPVATTPVAKRERYVSDPGAQALSILQRGENCSWYSIDRTTEQHEGFDCLEIYWRTEVERPEENEFGYGRGPFELKAGFRVRWHVAVTGHSYVEAVGLDLLTTILEARALADRLIVRARTAKAMGHEHPELEAWKARGAERKYSFHGLDVDKWSVRLDYPGGLSWAEDPDLDKAVANALAKAPV